MRFRFRVLFSIDFGWQGFCHRPEKLQQGRLRGI